MAVVGYFDTSIGHFERISATFGPAWPFIQLRNKIKFSDTHFKARKVLFWPKIAVKGPYNKNFISKSMIQYRRVDDLKRVYKRFYKGID